MSQNLSLLNLVTSVLGFVVFSLLIFSAKQNRFVNTFLGIAFFSAAYRSLAIYALEEHIVANTFLTGYVSFIYYFSAPCFYLYFRAVINDEQTLKKSDIIHFLAPALAILLLIYYIIFGYVQTGTFTLPVNTAPFGNQTSLPFYVQPWMHALTIFSLVMVYLILSWRLVFKKLRNKANEHPQVGKMRNWILTLLITCTLLMFILFFVAIFKVFFNRDIVYFINPDIARSVVLIFIFTRVLFKSDLLYGIPDLKTELPVIDTVPPSIQDAEVIIEKEETLIPEKNKMQEAPVQNEKSQPETVQENRELYFDKFGWIHLRENDIPAHPYEPPPAAIEIDKVIAYISAINKYLETAPYADPDFDIKSISTELKAPLYHIEYLFRYYNKYSFSEFRNAMRVQFVLDNFDKGLLKNFTLEAIGLKAGFSSRSSFFRVFKQVTGKTPKQVLDTIELPQ